MLKRIQAVMLATKGWGEGEVVIAESGRGRILNAETVRGFLPMKGDL